MPTLVDGTHADADSYEWLMECLARHLLKHPLDKRREFLATWDIKAPDLVADLRASMTACHEAKKRASENAAPDLTKPVNK